jgi:hypothetical protein
LGDGCDFIRDGCWLLTIRDVAFKNDFIKTRNNEYSKNVPSGNGEMALGNDIQEIMSCIHVGNMNV